LNIDQICVLLVRSELSVNQLERVSCEAGLVELERGGRLRVEHVLGRSLIKFDGVDQIVKVLALKNYSLNMHCAVGNCICDVSHSLLAGLIFALHSNYNPVVEHIKNLERLTRDFVKDQTSPSEEQIQAL
jgi:hypothetical protein